MIDYFVKNINQKYKKDNKKNVTTAKIFFVLVFIIFIFSPVASMFYNPVN